MHSATSDDRASRNGWIMVFVGFSLTAMSFGGLGSISVFLKPLVAEFGWSRGSTALGYTIAALGAASFGVLWGFLADRNPTYRFAFMGALAVAVAMLLLSQTAELWQFYLTYFLFGAFGHGALVSPIWSNIGQWFTQNKGLALGVALAGGAFGQAVVPFSARLLISAYGWQTVYLVLGVIFLVLGLAIASLTRDPPSKKAHLAALREAKEAGKSGGGWSLGDARHSVTWFSIAVIFCCTTMSTVIVHVVPMLSDRGFSPEIAAGALTTMMLAGALGRMSAGKICDMIGPLRTYAMMSLCQALLVGWFPHVDNLFGVYLLAAAFGLSFSGVMACMVISVGAMVQAQVNARCWSIVSFFGWLGMGIGSYMGGVLFDLTGGYAWSFGFAAAMGGTNLIVLYAFRLSRDKRQAALA